MKPLLPLACFRPLATLLALSALQAHAAEAPRCRYVMVAKLPLQYTGPSLQVTTQGVIDGTPATMLVDTGSYDSFLTRTGTEKRGMKLSNLGRVAQGVGGHASIYQTWIREFVAGPARSERGQMLVLSDFGQPPSYDAILGAPFLLQTDLEISLATKEIKFFQPVDCGDTHLAYWDAGALVVPFDSSFETTPTPEFTVLVNGLKMRAIIDTGATATTMSLAAAKRAGLQLDAPGVTPAGHAVGVGDVKVAYWHATFNTFQMGEEVIRNADIGVVDGKDKGVDVVLGDDFLRSHRVLFAMSQRKIYFSYVGGQPFEQHRKLESWIQAEADAGNGDAQMRVASMYARGERVAPDAAAAANWLEKAAVNGNGHANLFSGRALLIQGRALDAAPRLRLALDKLPSSRDAALWLYLARLRTGQAELGRTELTAAFARSQDGEWPAPVAAFYLGKSSAQQLLKQAMQDRELGRKRRCSAISAMKEWYEAQGDHAQGQAMAAARTEHCGNPADNEDQD
ncbi:aspartyl protease family protein [Massilia sp.]|uniref:aspartyl protease family protein n=1 Tax=Massilia sp. TaxID=1882437 RepID=UPI00289F4B80|nr:aspartyl protease family protein [Massilia sp.]